MECDVRAVLPDGRARLLGLVASVPPDRDDEAPLVPKSSKRRILGTIRHLARRPPKPADERAPGTEPPWRIQVDDGVRTRELQVERLVVVAVGDPGVTREQPAL